MQQHSSGEMEASIIVA